jgi:hypothetical protein
VIDRERFNTSTELADLAGLLKNRFFQRRDLQARQLDDGRYICIHKPLKPEALVKHLAGEITLGTYLLDENSAARFIVLDADDDPSFQRLMHAAQMLAVERTPSYLEASRRGGHLWLFFGNPIPGELARRFGKGVMGVHRVENVELYPKQDKLGQGPGSLIRAPFGVHRLTKLRYPFLNLEGQPLSESTEDQMRLMAYPRTVPLEAIKAYATMEKKLHRNPEPELPETRKEALSERIKNRITALEFISRYIDLKLTDTGAIGLCPFHDDQHPSLGVDAEKNYWYCFAGCGGGSVIDFWMKWRKCDFKTAIAELAKMVL